MRICNKRVQNYVNPRTSGEILRMGGKKHQRREIPKQNHEHHNIISPSVNPLLPTSRARRHLRHIPPQIIIRVVLLPLVANIEQVLECVELVVPGCRLERGSI